MEPEPVGAGRDESPMSFRATPELRQLINTNAVERGVSAGELIRRALIAYLLGADIDPGQPRPSGAGA